LRKTKGGEKADEFFIVQKKFNQKRGRKKKNFFSSRQKVVSKKGR